MGVVVTDFCLAPLMGTLVSEVETCKLMRVLMAMRSDVDILLRFLVKIPAALPDVGRVCRLLIFFSRLVFH